MAGFLDGFVEGFAQDRASKVYKQRDADLEVDTARKKALALIDPEEELAKRKAQVELDMSQKKRQQGFDAIQKYMGDSAPAQDGQNTAPQAVDVNGIDSVFQNMQKATQAKSKAQAAGDTQAAQYFDTQIDNYKQQMEYIKNKATIGGKPVTGAEGTNIVSDIAKQYDEDLKNKTSVSGYYPTKLNMLVNDPRVQPEHQRLNEEHQALAQAVASAKKESLSANTPEVSTSIKQDTQAVIRNLNVLSMTDSRITDKDKVTAAHAIENYFDNMSPVEQERVKNDPNFKRVFTPDVQATIQQYLSSAAPVTPSKPAVETKEQPTKTQPKAAGLTDNPKAQKIKADYKAGRLSRKDALEQLNALEQN